MRLSWSLLLALCVATVFVAGDEDAKVQEEAATVKELLKELLRDVDLFKQARSEAVKKSSDWEGAGTAPGLQVWRIVNFKVVPWPKEDYGKFFSGDSYIVLNTYKPDPASEKLAWDVHFWIGRKSTQDEYGTAAYQTVALDTYLDDAPKQHREIMDHESKLFKSYFPAGITIMEGGADGGFRGNSRYSGRNVNEQRKRPEDDEDLVQQRYYDGRK